jgi:hypothetical protein
MKVPFAESKGVWLTSLILEAVILHLHIDPCL